MDPPSLQEIAAPEGVCFGCGCDNPHGLHIKSYWHDDGIHVMARHIPEAQYTGWPGLVYGGLIAMLVDCHSNWTAMAHHSTTPSTFTTSMRAYGVSVSRRAP